MNTIKDSLGQESALKDYISGLQQTDEIPEDIKNKMAENINQLVKSIVVKKSTDRYTGYFIPEQKVIFIKEIKDSMIMKKTLVHELTHVASSEQDENGNVTRVGFLDIESGRGKGLNEAITEHYARMIYCKNNVNDRSKLYGDLFPVAKDLVELYGNDTILESYVNNSRKWELMMKQDGKDLEELKKNFDDYFIAVHEDKKRIYDSSLKIPEASVLYEKIGNFIEEIKMKRGITKAQSSWKKVHQFLLKTKSVDDYTIGEMYSNYEYFCDLKQKNLIDYKSCSIDNFDAKMIFVNGVRKYKKALNTIPGMAGKADLMVAEILDKITSAKMERYVRKDVFYDKVLKQIVFEKGMSEKSLISHMVLPLTRISFSKHLSMDNPYRGFYCEMANYIANEVISRIDNVEEKSKGKTDYSKMIGLFGARTTLDLNPDNIAKIQDGLSKAGVSNEFFEKYNVLYDTKASNDDKAKAEQFINDSIKMVSDYRENYYNNETWNNETRLEIPEKKIKFSWLQKIKDLIDTRIFGKNKMELLNEKNQEVQEKNDFLSSIKVDTNQLSPEFSVSKSKQQMKDYER